MRADGTKPGTAAGGPAGEWSAMPREQVLENLETDPRMGLTEDEARRRLGLYGPNRIEEADKTRWIAALARQFTSGLIFILMLAAVISVAMGEIADAAAILAIIVLNGVLGFVQEWKAELAIEALKLMLADRCRVVRGGRELETTAETIVPGDIVLLETGDRVPADLRLIESVNLKADESSLTGESVSVHKGIDPVDPKAPLAERVSMAWMGTSITNGRARGAVTATGMDTAFGRISRLTGTVREDRTPLGRELAALARQLGLLSISAAALVAAAGVYMEKSAGEMFLTAVSLAVAIVPEGLPAVVTITLALGIREMAARRALLRNLQAAEGLGAATVICTDKTGTLTKNEMTAQRVWTASGEYTVTGSGYAPEGRFEKDGNVIRPVDHPALYRLLETGVACNHARLEMDGRGWRGIGEPTEAALITAARKGGISRAGGARILSEFSFNSERKRMTIVEAGADGAVARVKGAPEIIIRVCSKILDGEVERPLIPEDAANFTRACRSMAEGGLRTLALAMRKLPAGTPLNEDAVENGLTLLGAVGMTDPARPEVPGAVLLGYSAGIKIIMITGDAAATAAAVAKTVGLRGGRVVAGSELDQMSDGQLDEALGQEAIFARVTPESKLRIVTRLQAIGHVVGMTGDGVNDAPALKKADVGIAMGIRGTDVARGASDMTLTDDNFASIIGAVEEGRRQYDNIRKFVGYLLSSNAGEVVAVLANVLMGGPLILLPAQILWINLVTDGVTAVALGAEPAERDVMKRPPRPPGEPILNRYGLAMISLKGAYIGLAALWLFHRALAEGGPDAAAHAHTMAFTGIVVMEMMNVFNFRSLRAPLYVAGYLSNPWIPAALGSMLAIQMAAVYAPFMQEALHTTRLTAGDWGMIFAAAAPVFVVVEAFKLLRWRTGFLDLARPRKDSIP